MIRNNTSFSSKITSKLKNLYTIYQTDKKWNNILNYYQYIILNILTNDDYIISDSRGLLLYFTMGIGKTRTAAAIALLLQPMKVIIILPKSLQKNFENTFSYVEKEIGKFYDSKLHFISMDAYNSAKQLENVENSINNSLIIIDEAHNFFKSVINSTKESNAIKIYNQIMNAKNIKILLLTGTPISKDPFELVPCINMLAGTELLPIYYEQFNNLYIDYVNNKIINKDFLANRLMGMVSYMTLESSDMFPTELPTIVSKVEMSSIQYRKYLQVREKEEIQKKSSSYSSSNNKPSPMSIQQQKSMSSYYIQSRSASNYVNPLPNESITNDNSPKMALIADRVLNCPGLSIVYSQFVNTHGLKQLTIFLKKVGFKEYKNASEKLQYAFYTGEVNTKYRDEIITIFNSDANKHGAILKVLLLSKTGAEGLDLKNVRETHQMEPYWDLARTNQLKARAIRFSSHLSLPLEERTVQPYIYISIANKKMYDDMKEKESKTIDEIFYERALEKYNIITQFFTLLQEVSIECSYFERNNCYVCNPTNERLFTMDPVLDTKLSNLCVKYVEEEKDVLSVTIDNDVYYYSINPFVVYKYNLLLDGYTEVENIDVITKVRNYIKNTDL
jgi:superfamily II DNA or RNA helicase